MAESKPIMAQGGKQNYLIGTVLFCTAFAIFWTAPVTQLTDSHYTLLLSDSLLTRQTFKLDHYAIARYEPQVGVRDDYVANGPMWQIEIARNHLYYYFPPGSAILSIPFVAIAKAAGVSVVNPDGSYNELGEIKLQKLIASILMALCVVVIYVTSRVLLPVTLSLLIAFGAGVGTQILSTLSRALWSHTWETLLASLVILLLVRNETWGTNRLGMLLGTLAGWLYFTRPSGSIVIMAIGVYLLLGNRRELFVYLLTGGLWLLGFMIYSWLEFGTLLPSYYKPNRLRIDILPVAFAGNLISPSRGLFVYVPIVLFVLFLILRYWGTVRFKLLAGVALLIIVLHLLLVSSFANFLGDWWAGASFGPRYLSELVPWFALLAALGFDAMHRSQKAASKSTSLVAGVLLVVSIFINTRGAISQDTWKWTQPRNDEEMRARLWDWKHPQFLAGLQEPPLPLDVPVLELNTKLNLNSTDVEGYLWYGWSGPEPAFRWNDGTEAGLTFRLSKNENMRLRLILAPFIVAPKLVQQRVSVNLNGAPLEAFSLADGPLRELDIRLPADKLEQVNRLVFGLPDAASPKSFNLNEDRRLLAIRVESLQLLADD